MKKAFFVAVVALLILGGVFYVASLKKSTEMQIPPRAQNLLAQLK